MEQTNKQTMKKNHDLMQNRLLENTKHKNMINQINQINKVPDHSCAP